MLTRRWWLLLTVILGTLTLVPAALGAPPSQDAQNLLTNGDFEEAAPTEGNLFRSGPGWKAWYLDAPSECYDQSPEFELSVGIPERNQSGNQALQIGVRDGTYTAGIYEKVDGVTEGQAYKFSIWGHVLYATSATATTSDGPDPRMKVGIDPKGGINPFASSVRWSEVDWEFDTYYQFSVVATAEKDTITVFTYVTQPDCLASNFTFWDDAQLVATEEAETPAEIAGNPEDTFRTISPDAKVRTTTQEFTVGGTPGGANEPAPAAAAEAAAAPTGTGSICLLMYLDENESGSREVNEAKLAGGIFTLTRDNLPVATYTSDGVAEPYCFSNLMPGNYLLTWQAEGYTATSSQGWAITLDAGETLSREFGAITSDEAESSGNGSTSRLLRSVAIALGAVIFLLVVGGVVVFVLVRLGSGNKPQGPPPRSLQDTVIHQ